MTRAVKTRAVWAGVGIVSLVVFLVAVVFIPRLIFRSKAAGNPTIGLGTSPLSAAVGQSFSVPVTINTDGNNIVAADIVLQFSTSALQLTDVVPNPGNSPLTVFLPFTSATTTFGKAQVMSSANSTGKIEFGAIAPPTGAGVVIYNGLLDQAHPLATLTFKVLQNTPTTVTVVSQTGNINDANLVSPAGIDLLASVSNLQVNVAAPTNTPIPVTATTVPTATSVPPTPTRTPTPVPPTPTRTPTPVPPTNTPAPSNTPVPTATIAPTATTVPGAGITLPLLLTGIGVNQTIQTPQRPVKVEVYDSQNQKVAEPSGTLTYNPTSGLFNVTLPLGSLPTGSYLIKVKTDRYLVRQIPGIVALIANQIVTLPQQSLVVGDIDSNNVINVIDYQSLFNCFDDKQNTPSCLYKQAADLNDDSVVDGIDLNLFLRTLAGRNGE